MVMAKNNTECIVAAIMTWLYPPIVAAVDASRTNSKPVAQPLPTIKVAEDEHPPPPTMAIPVHSEATFMDGIKWVDDNIE